MKDKPSLQKLRGGYYTPSEITDFLSEAGGNRLFWMNVGIHNRSASKYVEFVPQAMNLAE